MTFDTTIDDDTDENSTDDQPDTFAYGHSTWDDCDCPALAAGYTMTGDVTGVAVTYDDMVRDLHGGIRGTIDEERAREAWLAAIEHLRDNPDATPQAVAVGEEIARKLGWDA